MGWLEVWWGRVRVKPILGAGNNVAQQVTSQNPREIPMISHVRERKKINE